MRAFLIDEKQLARLDSAAKRLYSQERMNADAMRDMAQTLDHIVTVCRELPVDDEIGA